MVFIVNDESKTASNMTIGNIGICGKMFSGKTTLSDLFIEKYNYKRVAFGDKVKLFANEVKKVSPNFKDRELLQTIGDGARRIINPNIWIDALFYTIENDKKNKEDVIHICDDIRYENEAEALAKNGWTIIKLEIDDEEQMKRMKLKYPDSWEQHWERRNHNSEIYIDKIKSNFSIRASIPKNELFNKANDLLFNIKI